MNHKTSHALDIELSPHDVQALDSADAVVAFFARLGYNTDARTPQTPGNLGITAEGTAKPIKKIELIADQENLFQVYLFELASVTVAHTRALARSFRNRAGNYLLVLTSDYERLDFVLLEKYLPVGGGNGSGLGQKQVGVRPRALTVERRKPNRIHLRVLRRFTWTESDPFAQYDKLLSACAIADWSEEFFNNRALFSDYYLLERLRERPEWTEDPKPAYVRLHQLYEGATSRFAGREESVLRQELLEPVLQVLGFEAKPGKKSGSSAAEPDYYLVSKDHKSSPLALCLVYPWGRSLDGKDDQRDKETPEENPGAVVVSLLEKGEAPWAVVTNGKLWRLYAQRTHSRATNYYEIDLEEVLAQAGPHAADPAESFRYFWLLFRCQAFEPAEVERKGKKVSLSLLDQLFLESEDYVKELGERLKERVFEEVFPHLATGFITYIRERDGLHTDLSQEALGSVFQGTLTLLYRLLFLLYAEARDLLPVKEVRGYFAEAFINARDEKALKDTLNVLSSEYCGVAETALKATAEKRFFHWELEFPEVFYGPRSGTTQAIERLEDAGFDAVIGNPPYDVLSSEELEYDVSQDLAFYESAPAYEPAIRGKKNLYKLFICCGAAVMGSTGTFSLIVPMALLGDDQAAGVRRLLLEKTGLVAIEAFPQKDDAHHRVFPEAKLATTVFVTRAKPSNARVTVRTHPGRLIEEMSSLGAVKEQSFHSMLTHTSLARRFRAVVRPLEEP